MNRRNFLRLAGGGVILAAGGTALFTATRTPHKALAPWGQAGTYSDPRMSALSFAILAPNPHNRQPWIVSLEDKDALTLYFDTDKQLPHTDPLDRQLTIGLGCFLELMRMAAAANGYLVETTLFPEGSDTAGLDGRPIAHVRFKEADTMVGPLWAHVLDRRSNKEPFDTARPIASTALQRILGFARSATLGGTINAGDIAAWRKLTSDAMRIEVETPRT
ncbi:MAG: twin-arginine translocation pathway signal protein, partial [Silicimonas sp.]|nr:twin-arginine translocation pathway signal protein [Silicimonas sp.]